MNRFDDALGGLCGTCRECSIRIETNAAVLNNRSRTSKFILLTTEKYLNAGTSRFGQWGWSITIDTCLSNQLECVVIIDGFKIDLGFSRIDNTSWISWWFRHFFIIHISFVIASFISIIFWVKLVLRTAILIYCIFELFSGRLFLTMNNVIRWTRTVSHWFKLTRRFMGPGYSHSRLC